MYFLPNYSDYYTPKSKPAVNNNHDGTFTMWWTNDKDSVVSFPISKKLAREWAKAGFDITG